MTTPPQPPAGGASGGHGGSLLSRIGGSRNGAILAAGATVGVVALLASFRGKSNSGTTLMSSGDFDSSPYDMWNAWQSEYEDLQQQINASGGGSTSASGPGQPPKSTLPAPIPKPPIPTPAPKPPPPKPKPKPGHKIVTVKHGDTLSEIAAKNHISMAQLKKLNPTYWKNKKYDNGNRIWAGDKVKVS